MIDGTLYVTTPYNNVAAVDAETANRGKPVAAFGGHTKTVSSAPGEVAMASTATNPHTQRTHPSKASHLSHDRPRSWSIDLI